MRAKTLACVGAVAVLLGWNAALSAGSVLLGTISNTWHGTDPSVIEEYSAGDRFLYSVIGYAQRGDLFEDSRVVVRLNAPPVTIDEFVTVEHDPDFELIARLLTDGVSLGSGDGAGFQEISVLGLVGGENMLDVHVPRISAYDLFGYEVERVARHVTFSITSHPRDIDDPEGGTDFRIGGVYEFWGSAVPEPAALWLLATGGAVLFGRAGRPRKAQVERSLVPGALKLTLCFAVLCVVVGTPAISRGDTVHRDLAGWTLWRTGTACSAACPLFEQNTAVPFVIGPLSEAEGNVTVEVIPFADLSDNVDGGNGYGYYDLYIGGTRMTSGVDGHVSGAPADGKFRKTNGSRPSYCCWHTGNIATIVVTDSFFNSRLGAAGAGPDELFVQIHIPSGSNVPCAAVANGCANMDDGTHRVTVTWTPAPQCNPPDCNDGNPCTTDACVSGVCQNNPNNSPCNDGIYCNGTDTCSGGSCGHTGDPCGGCCDETHNNCGLAIVSSDPPDGAIDARQPSQPNGSNPAGWNSVALTMSGVPGPIDTDDFTVTTTGGTAPNIANLTVNGSVVTLQLNTFIPTGQWTQFTHDCSGTSTCLGYLPADVSNDGTSGPVDILYVIDCLNQVRICAIWQCDADRSGVCAPADVLRVIDLLNGADAYDPWLGISLPGNPCEVGGEGGFGMSSEGAVALGEVNAEFIQGFVTYLATTVIADAQGESDFRQIVHAVTGFCVKNLSPDEQKALADKLQDPSLTFASSVAAEEVPKIVDTLLESLPG